MLFGGSVTACDKTQSPCISIKSTPTTNYIDMDDEKENNYMSPIVSISWMNFAFDDISITIKTSWYKDVILHFSGLARNHGDYYAQGTSFQG